MSTLLMKIFIRKINTKRLKRKKKIYDVISLEYNIAKLW